MLLKYYFYDFYDIMIKNFLIKGVFFLKKILIKFGILIKWKCYKGV